jgi:hypothetical protein
MFILLDPASDDQSLHTQQRPPVEEPQGDPSPPELPPADTPEELPPVSPPPELPH